MFAIVLAGATAVGPSPGVGRVDSKNVIEGEETGIAIGNHFAMGIHRQEKLQDQIGEVEYFASELAISTSSFAWPRLNWTHLAMAGNLQRTKEIKVAYSEARDARNLRNLNQIRIEAIQAVRQVDSSLEELQLDWRVSPLATAMG